MIAAGDLVAAETTARSITEPALLDRAIAAFGQATPLSPVLLAHALTHGEYADFLPAIARVDLEALSANADRISAPLALIVHGFDLVALRDR